MRKLEFENEKKYESTRAIMKDAQSNQKIITLSMFSVVVILALLFFGYWVVNPTLFSTQGENDEKIDLKGKVVETKVESTVASANIYIKRMGYLYDGVCRDISVVEPVECMQTSDSYVIYAAISETEYYCVDSKEFRGIIFERPSSGVACN